MEGAGPRQLKLAFLPGTGKMGGALARIYAKAGYTTFISSRSLESATKAAEEIRKDAGESASVTAGTHEQAAASADVVFWALGGGLEDRHAALKSLKEQLKGKIVVDLTNIGYLIDETQWGQVSSVEQNMDALGLGPEEVKWTHAYKSTFYFNLAAPVDSQGNKRNILIGGDDAQAVDTLAALIESTGYGVTRTGGLKFARIVELMGPKWIVAVDNANGKSSERGYWRYVKY